MKRISIMSIIFTLNCFVAKAQTVFSEAILITDQTDVATSVFACDLDNDGDEDVISSSYFDNKIAWYENTDGNGTFGEQKIISFTANGANCVFACDIDGDQDFDVISACWLGNKICWYENTDGNGNFSQEKLISNLTSGAHKVFACDIDGDGDYDILSASYYDNKIAWYKNIDGNGNFGGQQIITTMTDQTLSVFATDLDSDGDNDVLSASRNDDKIAWYENTDGNGNFGLQRVISTTANGAFCVFACDIDSDGDNDVLSASEYDNKIAWYENTDGNGNFSPQKIISTTAGGAEVVYACDLDNDGDNDVLSACYWDQKIAWYENTDGDGTFGTEQIISTASEGAFSVFASDIDGDTDSDVLAAWGGSNRIEWYRNEYITSIEDNLKHSFQSNYTITNYPNPFNPSTKIRYSLPQTSNVVIKIFDILGNAIETLVNEDKEIGTYEIIWNAKSLPNGVYFYQLKAGDFVETKKMLLIK